MDAEVLVVIFILMFCISFLGFICSVQEIYIIVVYPLKRVAIVSESDSPIPIYSFIAISIHFDIRMRQHDVSSKRVAMNRVYPIKTVNISSSKWEESQDTCHPMESPFRAITYNFAITVVWFFGQKNWFQRIVFLYGWPISPILPLRLLCQ